MDSPGILEFKFAANGSWTINLGAQEEQPKRVPIQATGQLNGANIQAEIPAPGRYRFEADISTLEYTVQAVPATDQPN